MSKENAQLLKQAYEDPQDVDELWERLEEKNKNVDWDLERMLSKEELSEE